VTDTVLVAIIAAIPGAGAVILGFINRKKLGDVSAQVDGRLTELLELTRKSSHAEGMKDEKSNRK
jgi:hypothetical protein